MIGPEASPLIDPAPSRRMAALPFPARKTPMNTTFEGTDTYVLDPELREVVNISIALEMPLLLKGEPGTGLAANQRCE